MSVVLLLAMIGSFGGMIAWTVLIQFMPYATAAIVLGVLGVGISMSIFITKVAETKKVDLATVTGAEWDKVKPEEESAE